MLYDLVSALSGGICAVCTMATLDGDLVHAEATGFPLSRDASAPAPIASAGVQAETVEV